MDNAVLKFKLTNFLGAFVSEVENAEGNIEECVCIPLHRNNLKKTKKNDVSAYCYVNRTKLPLDGWTHYLQMKTSYDFVKKLNEQGYKNPYLGNIRQDDTLGGKKITYKTYVKTLE